MKSRIVNLKLDENRVTRTRKNTSNKLLLVVASNSKCIECLDLDFIEDGFSILTEIPTMRYGFGGAGFAARGDIIAVTGGVGRAGVLKATKRFLVYDVRANVWLNDLPELNEARKSHACEFLDNGILMVAGGTDDRAAVLTVEYIDLNLPQHEWRWTMSVTRLTSWHNGAAAVNFFNSLLMISAYGADNDKLFDMSASECKSFDGGRMSRDHPGVTRLGADSVIIAGGSLGKEYLKQTEIYSANRRWVIAGDLNIGREGPGLVYVGEGAIWAIGGRGSKGTVERFHHRQWQLVENLKVSQENDEYLAAVIDKGI